MNTSDTTFHPIDSQSPIDERPVSIDNQTSSYNSAGTTPLKSTPMNNRLQKTIIISSIIAVVAGVATGFGGYKLMAKSQQPVGPATQPVTGQALKAGDVFGSQNTDAFKDSAQGYLTKGGLDGEGSHKILRPGGETQTVYLTSSVTDLDQFDGMEVKIWGETFKAQKAGWLMDVGRVEVVNPEAEAPIEE